MIAKSDSYKKIYDYVDKMDREKARNSPKIHLCSTY